MRFTLSGHHKTVPLIVSPFIKNTLNGFILIYECNPTAAASTNLDGTSVRRGGFWENAASTRNRVGFESTVDTASINIPQVSKIKFLADFPNTTTARWKVPLKREP
jgi:hypothetical protein